MVQWAHARDGQTVLAAAHDLLAVAVLVVGVVLEEVVEHVGLHPPGQGAVPVPRRVEVDVAAVAAEDGWVAAAVLAAAALAGAVCAPQWGSPLVVVPVVGCVEAVVSVRELFAPLEDVDQVDAVGEAVLPDVAPVLVRHALPDGGREHAARGFGDRELLCEEVGILGGDLGAFRRFRSLVVPLAASLDKVLEGAHVPIHGVIHSEFVAAV